jgi:hypothetical protein
MTNDVDGSGGKPCSTAEQVVYGLVVGPTAADIGQIASQAMFVKTRFFQESGWDVNHKITEGDVKCVLRAILQIAEVRMKRGQ